MGHPRRRGSKATGIEEPPRVRAAQGLSYVSAGQQHQIVFDSGADSQAGQFTQIHLGDFFQWPVGLHHKSVNRVNMRGLYRGLSRGEHSRGLREKARSETAAAGPGTSSALDAGYRLLTRTSTRSRCGCGLLKAPVWIL